MIKLKRIIIITLIIIYITIFEVYGEYIYQNEFALFRLNRNITKPVYTKTYNKETWTNEDVLITINSDKILELIDGDFVLNKDGKTLTKTIKQNEKGIIKVRDEDYNYDEIQYEVSWIDKEKPKILGAENNQIYNSDLHLEYEDNGEIDDIFVDRYGTEFNVYEKDVFMDSGSNRFVPFTKNSITAWVREHPKGIEKYRYYLNDVLYETTKENKYIFKNLEEVKYDMKVRVEGLDRNDEIIASKEYIVKTGIFDDVILEKTETVETVKFTGIPDNVTKLVFYRWIDGKYNSTLKYGDVNIEKNEAVCTLNINDFKNVKNRYIMHFYFYYNVDGQEKVFIYGGSTDMTKPYEVLNENPSKNDFIADGNYYVRVKDKAGNENEIDFIIQK